MISSRLIAKFVMGAALVAAPAASYAGVFISVGIAPPALPVYVQPPIPGDGYIWTPGYWAYGPVGYYWVPGVWVQPPTVGYLWTPPYWGFAGGVYGFHDGYWGSHIGFYGGVNYGFGYGGVGYEGGYWNGGHFFYNSRVNAFGGGFRPVNVYERNVTIVNNNYAHTSFNGGPNGIPYRANQQELQASHEQHVGVTANQTAFRQQAANNPGQRFSANQGRPAVLGSPTTRDGFGHANEVNTRQGNQQARINNGVRSGQMTPGETRNVENRDTSIRNQAATDRAANGGNLTNNQRAQINQRQNNVSRSINNDNHNGNNDAAAAARQGRTTQQVQGNAARAEQNHAPAPGPAARPAPAPAARPAAAPAGGGEHGGGHEGAGRPRR